MLPWALVALLAVATMLLALRSYCALRRRASSYKRLTFEAGTVYSARFAPDGQSIVYSAAWNGKPVQLFSTVGDSLLTQPLNLNDANLLAISRNNELAVVLHGTHNGQLETVGGMLARAPLAGGSPKELLADVRWADWDAQGDLAVVHYVDGHSRLEYPIGKVLYQSSGWISNIRFSPQGDQNRLHGPSRALGQSRRRSAWSIWQGNVQTLTREWESEQGVAWRPDGKEIWFTAIEKGTNLNLMAVTLSGQSPHRAGPAHGNHSAGHCPRRPRPGGLELQAPGPGVQHSGQQRRCGSFLARLECRQGYFARRTVCAV